MHVNLYASFSERAGIKHFEIPIIQPVTVFTLVDQIIQTYPGLRGVWLDETDLLHAHVHVSLNQVDVMSLPDKMKTMVQDGDVLDFFPPIHGG